MPVPADICLAIVSCSKAGLMARKAVYIGDGVVLCRVLGTYFMYADAEDLGIAPHFALNGFWESEVTLALAREVQARILVPRRWRGLRVLHVGPRCRGGSTGPRDSGRTESALGGPHDETLDVNGFLGHVGVVSRAVSDRPGEPVEFYIPPRRGMNAIVVSGETSRGSTIEARTETIDQLTADWPRVDLVKIDVKGSEQAVWRGMQRVLDTNEEITIILEVNAARYEDPVAFLEEIERCGFALRYISLNGDAEHITKKKIASSNRDWMLFLMRESDSAVP